MLGEFMGYFVAVPVNVPDFYLMKAATYLPKTFYNVDNNPVSIWQYLYNLVLFSKRIYYSFFFYFLF